MSANLKCTKPDCQGIIEDGLCTICGATAQTSAAHTARQEVLDSLRSLLKEKEASPSKDDLAQAAKLLTSVVPYNYDAWRLHANLLLNALRQLQTRQIQPDATFTLLTVPLREQDIADAAEAALRQCAHYADSAEKRIHFVDEANRIRRTTWF
jgi:hypothetical protein